MGCEQASMSVPTERVLQSECGSDFCVGAKLLGADIESGLSHFG